MLSGLMEEHGLTKYIIKNPSQEGDIPQRTLASMIEAIIEAVWFGMSRSYLDSSLLIC